MDQQKISGRCLCGEVRYDVKGGVDEAFYCHCESCRRSAGAPYVAWGRVHTSQFSVKEGEVTSFNSSPGATRGRCVKCGTEIIFQHAESLSQIDFLLATLDSPDEIPPRYHVRTAEKLSWVELNDDLPKFEGWRPKSEG